MAGHSRSPLAPEAPADLPAIAGVRLATAETGIRYKNRPDFLLAELAPGTTVAGVFTTSKSRSAPVDWCAASLKAGDARALVVNSGNANAFTGKAGVRTVTEVAGAAAKLFDGKPKQIFQASTGVIGEPLDPEPIIKALNEAGRRLREDAWADAARAIMTTDTFAKAATVTAKIGRSTVTINGIAKGSGMIAPDMATMLVFLFTDAKLPARVLQKLLIGEHGQELQLHHSRWRYLDFGHGFALRHRCGRGSFRPPFAAMEIRASKALPRPSTLCASISRIRSSRTARGRRSSSKSRSPVRNHDKAARRIGMAIANSPLVKTAIAGEDANWGRIVMAIGKSGEKAERDRLKIKIGGMSVAKNGMRDPTYKEAEIMPHMKGRSIAIAADVGVGRGKATVWTCDLTHRYIDINGSYRS